MLDVKRMVRMVPGFLLLGFSIAAPGGAQRVQEFAPRVPARHPAAEVLAAGRATALAAADFDGDGVRDLAVAYRSGERGALAVFRGEYAALYPHFPAGVARRQALGGGAVAPFEGEPLWALAGEAADFLAAGDFDADGRADLVSAGRGGNRLAFHRGDGRGGFAAAAFRFLPAPPTALGAFDLDLADGLPEIVAAVEDGDARQIVRFGGTRGAWPAAPRVWASDLRVSSLLAQRLDGDAFYDLALGGDLPAGGGGWRQIPGVRGDEKAPLAALAAAPSRQLAARTENSLALPLRLDDNALQDFALIDAAGRVVFEITGPSASFLVNTRNDVDDGACNAAHCSLREAIRTANAVLGACAIEFAIPGPAPYRIEPLTPLPAAIHPLTIDGSTQPGFAGLPLIEIHGGSTDNTHGLWLQGHSSVLRSLVVGGFEASNASLIVAGIWIDGSDSLVEGCYVGTGVGGMTPEPNQWGLFLNHLAHHAQVGGTAAGAGNLIAGNTKFGMVASSNEWIVEGNILGLDRFGTNLLGTQWVGFNSDGVAGVVGGTAPGAGNVFANSGLPCLWAHGSGQRIQGNRVGTDITGELARPGLGCGISLSGADHLVGGTAAPAANLVSGNTWAGIDLFNATGVRVENNRIGVAASGLPLGNGGPGVQLEGARNRVGSDDPAGGNLIVNNRAGIECRPAGLANRILGNSSYLNGGGANIACSDPGPVLTAASPDPGGTRIDGFFDGSPNQGYRLEFFRAEDCGFGPAPAKYFVGSLDVTTDAGGHAPFTFQNPAIVVPAGQVVAATANPLPLVPAPGDTLNATSISACRLVTGGGPSIGTMVRMPGHVIGSLGEKVSMPVLFTSFGHAVASTAFAVNLGNCVSFDPTDANADGLPDDIRPHLPAGWSAHASYQPADTDGELKLTFFDLPPFIPLGEGNIVDIRLTVTCGPTAMQVEPLPFEHFPFPSMGNTQGQPVGGSWGDGFIDIYPGRRGDCNHDGNVDAADLAACGLEIFDGDGDQWWNVALGSFPGSPIGCDSNADTLVDAGDLACKVLLINQLPCGNNAQSPGSPPLLTTGAAKARAAAVAVPIVLQNAGGDLTAAIFSLDLAPGVAFDPADGDADGLPDAVTMHYAGSFRSITYHPDDTDGEIHVMLADLAAHPLRLPAGPLFEITVDPGSLAPAAAIVFGADPPPSYGRSDGSSTATTLFVLFADGFESGNVAAWSSAVP